MVYCHFNFRFSNTEATGTPGTLPIPGVTLQTHFDVFNSEISSLLSKLSNLQSTQPYPRIDKGVKNIEGQIDEYVNQPEEKTNAH